MQRSLPPEEPPLLDRRGTTAPYFPRAFTPDSRRIASIVELSDVTTACLLPFKRKKPLFHPWHLHHVTDPGVGGAVVDAPMLL
jgi:hypothetical protein